MSREKLLRTQPRGENARRLRQLMLDYNAFRQARRRNPHQAAIEALAQWQIRRLRQTHQDLYNQPQYRQGLDFLLEDLYDSRNFLQRDDDFERVFPTLVRLLPDSVLYTVAQVVELNLLTQRLDLELAELIFGEWQAGEVTPENYAQAYRQTGRIAERRHQIQLVANVGDDLARYVNSRTLRFALSATRRPADMAGLGRLHQFLRDGVSAFRAMGDVNRLLDRLIRRELWILEEMVAGRPLPEQIPKDL